MARVTRLPTLRTVALLALLGCSAAEEPVEEAPATPVPGLQLLTVTVSPPSGLPGTRVTVRAHIPAGIRETPLRVFRAESSSAAMGAWTAAADGYTAETEVVTTGKFGTQVLGVDNSQGAQWLVGYATFNATSADVCPEGQVREGDACHPVTQGHALVVHAYAQVSAGHPTGVAPDDSVRTMLHPRELVRVGSATVGCHSDHIGIVWLGDFAQAGVTPPPRSNDAEQDGVTQRTETVFKAVRPDLAYCENFALSGTIGITGHRGTDGKLGGLATWRIPDLTAPKCDPCTARFDPPLLLDLVTDERGYEGLVVRDEVLYAAQKPGRLAVFKIGSDGVLKSLADLVVPELKSAWNLALDGDTLFISDPSPYTASAVIDGPGGTQHYGHIHNESGGRLFSVDVSSPSAPKPLGWAPTGGASKTMAVLPSHMIAVANGAAGVELFDASNPAEPVSVWAEDTPGTATDVSYANGYLLEADWDSIRLYDASETGVLRLIDAGDLSDFGTVITEAALAALGPDLSEGAPTFGPPLAMAFARLQPDGSFFANDLDRIFYGQITTGARGPRLLLHETRRAIRTGADAPTASFSVRVSNGGTEPTWVRLETDDQITAPNGGRLLAPGATATLEVKLTGLDRSVPPFIHLATNDPFPAERKVQIDAFEGHYNVGDVAPRIALPAVNWCDENGHCDLSAKCIDTYDPPEKRRPILMAVFTSW